MKKTLVHLILGIAIILFIGLAGCVAPPKETKVTPTGIYDPNQPATTQTTAPASTGLVTPETPYVTLEPVSASNTTNPLAYRTLPPVTQIQEDYVIIYSFKNKPFGYNKTAISFDLKNPPMLIDFAVSVANITGERTFTSKSGENAGKDQIIKTNYPDPSAWFEVTVRKKVSGEVILQDGFGPSKQYESEHHRHLKVLTPGTYLIEFGGNQLTATVNLSVKRAENINQSIG